MDVDSGVSAETKEELCKRLGKSLGQIRHYTPDIEALFLNDFSTLEAKHSSFLKRQAQKFEDIDRVMASQNRHFLLLTERELWKGGLDDNLHLLYNSIVGSPVLEQEAIEKIREYSEDSFSLGIALGALKLSLPEVLEAIRLGELAFDLCGPRLNYQTFLTKSYGA